MRIETLEDETGFARRAADLIGAPAGEGAVLALPSGNTPLAAYAELARRVRGGELDLAGVTAFALDELHGVSGAHPGTNLAYFRRHLDVSLRALHVFDSEAAEPEAECHRIASLVAEAGGIDLAVLGIGANGHIAFNEPGSPPDSRARPVELERSTREGLRRHFGALEAVPRRGLTLGVADLMAARRVLLLATGEAKAAIVAEALEGPVTPEVPASALQRHPDLSAILDRSAAARLGSN